MSVTTNHDLSKGDIQHHNKIQTEVDLIKTVTNSSSNNIANEAISTTVINPIKSQGRGRNAVGRKRSYSTLTATVPSTTTTTPPASNTITSCMSYLQTPIATSSIEALSQPNSVAQSKHSKIDIYNSISLSNYNSILNKYQALYSKQNDEVVQFFTTKNEFSDLTLLFADGKTLYASKSILAAASNVYKGKLSENTAQLEVTDAKYEEMIELLQFLYPQFHAKLNLDNITSLMRLSEAYEIRTLADACREYAMQYVQRIHQVKLTRDPQYLSTSNGQVSTNAATTSNIAAGTNSLLNLNGTFNNLPMLECIQYSDGTRYPAFIECNRLCSWLKIYSPLIGVGFTTIDELIETILNILQKLSLKVLQQSQEFQLLSDSDKNLIYVSRAKFLETELAKLDYFTNRVYDINLNFSADF